MIALRPPTLGECQQVRLWRNDPAVLPMLRTGYKTEGEQSWFYRRHIEPSRFWRIVDAIMGGPNHRYFAVVLDGAFVGMGGLTYLRREPGVGEISLILGPAHRGKGVGEQAVAELLNEAARMDLYRVVGECYYTGAVRFWRRVSGLPVDGWRTASAVRACGSGAFMFGWEKTA